MPNISKFFPQHPGSLEIFILFFMASICRDLPIETIKIYKIEYFFLVQPYLKNLIFFPPQKSMLKTLSRYLNTAVLRVILLLDLRVTCKNQSNEIIM